MFWVCHTIVEHGNVERIHRSRITGRDWPHQSSGLISESSRWW